MPPPNPIALKLGHVSEYLTPHERDLDPLCFPSDRALCPASIRGKKLYYFFSCQGMPHSISGLCIVAALVCVVSSFLLTVGDPPIHSPRGVITFSLLGTGLLLASLPVFSGIIIHLKNKRLAYQRTQLLTQLQDKYCRIDESIIDAQDLPSLIKCCRPEALTKLISRMSFKQQHSLIPILGVQEIQRQLELIREDTELGVSIETYKTSFILGLATAENSELTGLLHARCIQDAYKSDNLFRTVLCQELDNKGLSAHDSFPQLSLSSEINNNCEAVMTLTFTDGATLFGDIAVLREHSFFFENLCTNPLNKGRRCELPCSRAIFDLFLQSCQKNLRGPLSKSEIQELMILADFLQAEAFSKLLQNYIVNYQLFSQEEIASLLQSDQSYPILKNFYESHLLSQQLTTSNVRDICQTARACHLESTEQKCIQFAKESFLQHFKSSKTELSAAGLALYREILSETDIDRLVAELPFLLQHHNLAVIYAFAEHTENSALLEACYGFCRTNAATLRQNIPWRTLDKVPEHIYNILFKES